jgi:omega-amidase
MRFACVQYDIVWEDKAANHAIIERMFDLAKVPPGAFVLLPELSDTGFSMNLETIADERTIEWGCVSALRRELFLQIGFARLARETASVNTGCSVGRNCAAIIAPDGSILGEYQKVHPFSYGKESQFYSGGDHLLLRRCGEAIVCPLICYDLRFPELWRLAALRGAEVFAIGASWPAARQHHWRALLIARAIENQAYVVAVNRVGSDAHLKYAGGSIIVSPAGEILAEADDRPLVVQADLDLAALREWRKEFPALRDVHRDLLGTIAVDGTNATADFLGPAQSAGAVDHTT